MQFRELAERMREIESTASRLEMARLLSDALKAASSEETPIIAHMLLGKLAPDHEGVEVGLAHKMVLSLLERRTGRPSEEIEALVHETGDLGTATEQLWEQPMGGQVGLGAFADEADEVLLDVTEVRAELVRIARTSGAGSQDKKVGLAWRLLDRASPVEARYIVRFLAGKLRLGVADMTLLDAAAIAFAPDEHVLVDEKDELPRPPAAWREAMERAYNLTSDIGGVLVAAREEGLDAVQAVQITPGRPVRPMLAERSTDPATILENVGSPALAEYKYDGLRSQAHLDGDAFHLFSRRLEDVTDQFPDIHDALVDALADHSVVVEGEAVPVDPDTGRLRPFQDISRRRGRKHDLQQAIDEIPIHLYLFDLLYADGEDMTVQPLGERRARLAELVGEHDRVHVSHGREVADEAGLESFFDDAMAWGAEGVMVKSLNEGSTYQAGARGWRWVKYKKDYVEALADSLDLVIVGAWHGRGRRAGWYGALLGAAWNAERGHYETVCKIGTGFTDADLADLNGILDPHRSEGPPSAVDVLLEPDVWFEPAIVAEVRGAELSRSPVHTCGRSDEGGIALRFPRFIRWRDEKGPEDATTTTEVADMFRAQRAGPEEE